MDANLIKINNKPYINKNITILILRKRSIKIKGVNKVHEKATKVQTCIAPPKNDIFSKD